MSSFTFLKDLADGTFFELFVEGAFSLAKCDEWIEEIIVFDNIVGSANLHLRHHNWSLKLICYNSVSLFNCDQLLVEE